MKKTIFNYYMEHSKSFVLLHIYLAIQEIMNTPIKAILLLIPIGMYLFIMTTMRGYLEMPFLSVASKEIMRICINILLVVMMLVLELAVMVSIGRSLHNKETAVIKEALRGTNEKLDIIHLIYKRKRGNQIERRIYSHVPKTVWEDKTVYNRILQVFDEHFPSARFTTDKKNSRITIMQTKTGYYKPVKSEYHDQELDKAMEEVE